MRTLLFTLTISGMAFSAMAQSAAPMVVIDTTDDTAVNAASAAEADTPIAFPAAAVTRVGANTTGQNDEAPIAPAAPAADVPVAPEKAPNAPVAESPPIPKAPIDKLWPVDTVPIFMASCVGVQPKLIAPCKCVIGRLMTEMPHDEFLQLSINGTIEQDPRLRAIRLQCVGTPSVKSDE